MKKNAKKKTKKKGAHSASDDLFSQVVSMTGIPSRTIKRELKVILERKNIDVESLTIEQLRTVVASYLREIMSGLLDKYNHRKTETNH